MQRLRTAQTEPRGRMTYTRQQAKERAAPHSDSPDTGMPFDV